MPTVKLAKASSRRSSIETDNTQEDPSSQFLEGDCCIDAQNILAREQRRKKKSTFATPKFHEDLEALSIRQQPANDLNFEDRASEKSRTTSTRTARRKRNNSKEMKRRVSFDAVTVREYPIVVGVNPSVTNGPPLTIDWDHVDLVHIDIERYETCRVPHRRSQQEMRMSNTYRQELLERMGFSFLEIELGTITARSTRTKRRSSNMDLKNDSKAEKREKVVRFVRNIITLGMKNYLERRYLKQHCPNYEKPVNNMPVIQLTY